MKNVVKPLILLMGTAFFSSIAVASPHHPIMIVNNTKMPMVVSYSMCDADKKICSLIKEHKLGSSQAGNNHLTVLGELKPKLENLTITAAAIVDANGNKVASLSHGCDLPTNAGAVILDNYGTSRIICQYGQYN